MEFTEDDYIKITERLNVIDIFDLSNFHDICDIGTKNGNKNKMTILINETVNNILSFDVKYSEKDNKIVSYTINNFVMNYRDNILNINKIKVIYDNGSKYKFATINP